MIDDIIRPYPGENEVSFAKRKAYYFRILDWRINYGNKSVEKKLPNSTPISAKDKKEIGDFWNKYLAPELHEKFIDYRYYDVFNKVLREGEHLWQYIPDTFFYSFVDEYFSNPQHSDPCDDKNLYDLYFHDINRPRTVFRKVNNLFLDAKYDEISQEEALIKARECGEVILKIGKFSYGGHGILFWSPTKNRESELIEFLKGSSNIICQEVIKQHPVLKSLNPSSVNTIRMMTLLFNDKIHVLSSVVRMGINGCRTDNASSGGIVCGIRPDGYLKDVAYDTSANVYLKHPQGTKFEGIQIPNYSLCVEFAIRLAKRFSSITKLISWDVAIDENGQPMLIEFGVSNGQMDFHQLCNGPILGELTEDVLHEVFSKSYTLTSILKSLG